MRRTPLTLAVLVVFGLLTTACATNQERFQWGGYEHALYIYSKKPDQGPLYEKALADAIQAGRAKDRVAPGLLAELGYMRLEHGDTVAAIPLFEEEMTRFPESRAFLVAVVARAKGQPQNQGGHPQ